MSRNVFNDLHSKLDWRGFLVGTATTLAVSLAWNALSAEPRTKTIASPRATLLPNLSEQEKNNLPYPPDALPGARDVESPYGTFRAYEFGPEDGRKVLLIHGISTPCLALGGVAHGLADKGCRVLLFDLAGRGYSDTPSDLDHDIRLFTTQILVIIASSPLSWIGSASGGGFSIVGYSLGGGIGAAFASFFPELVKSLVLIAPSGLIRPVHFSRVNRVLYSKGVIPEPILHRLVKSRLQKPVTPDQEKNQQEQQRQLREQREEGRAGPATAVQAEINIEANQQVVLSQKHPHITIEAAVNHQVHNHQGFVAAFMSSIRNGPIHSQHDSWRRIGAMLTRTQQKALIILGEHDPLINMDETKADVTEVLGGPDNVDFAVVDAGHEAPVAKGPEVADIIWNFWQQQQVK